MSDLFVPEISYANTDVEQVKTDIISGIETSLGRTLYPADPLKLFALAFAAEDINIRNLIDEAGRQNLLAYATGTNLDALGDLIGVTRLAALGALTTIRFTAQLPHASPIYLPQGTRVTPDGQTYFATIYPWLINAQIGQSTGDVPARCTTTGEMGNGYLPGEIDTIVDVIPQIISAVNTDTSAGGADTETDDAYRERIRLAVTQFSVAGSRDAYEFWARSVSPAISDVYVTSPTPGYVDVYVLLQDGELPDAAMLSAVETALSDDDIRPLTDFVTAKAPGTSNYTVNITYYIKQADSARAAEIQTAVEDAVDAWILWQKSAIGRDVNPSELIAGVMAAGARRVAVTAPNYAVIPNTNLAILSGSATVTYGGLEGE